MRYIIFLSIIAATFGGCTPDKGSADLGPLPKASFTVTAINGAVNTYALSAASTGVFSYYWDPGDGSGQKQGNGTDTLYYKNKGNYRVTLMVLGHGGMDTVSQIVQVASDDPGVNILPVNDLTSASNWTVLNTGATQNNFNFTSQGLNMSNDGNPNTNGAVYQAVQVKAGVKYTFSAMVQGVGANNSWVEFYLGTSAPVQGSDYSDNKVYSLNTYTGCGKVPFSGNIVNVGCNGSGAGNGLVTFPNDGTVYVLIKAGSNGGGLGTGGVTVTSIGLNAPSH